MLRTSWSGIALGLYILLMSVTGSVLVYSNELYRGSHAQTESSEGGATTLDHAQLAEAATHLYPGYRVASITRATDLDQAVDVWLRRGDEIKEAAIRSPGAGSDLGNSIPLGISMVSKLIDLHDNLFGGSTGRKVNGAGAFALIALAVTGLAVWWPGIKTWRRSLTLHRGLGWKRLNWHLHSMVGFWSFGFMLVFGLSGVYLCFSETVQDFADWLQPPTVANAGIRMVDRIMYWLAFLHFGRIQGIGIPCSGPGLCDQTTKAVWAIFGLAPAVMFVTGAIMWWNRVLRPELAGARRAARSRAVTAS